MVFQGTRTSTRQATIERSEDYSLLPSVRSGIRHELIDEAHRRDDNRFWREVARALVKAHGQDDLSGQVSDHFVNLCPDHIFREFTGKSPRHTFKNWSKRARRMGR